NGHQSPKRAESVNYARFSVQWSRYWVVCHRRGPSHPLAAEPPDAGVVLPGGVQPGAAQGTHLPGAPAPAGQKAACGPHPCLHGAQQGLPRASPRGEGDDHTPRAEAAGLRQARELQDGAERSAARRDHALAAALRQLAPKMRSGMAWGWPPTPCHCLPGKAPKMLH
ncbi:unnamed protein product, partial [Ixodes pacificus]